MSYLRYTCRDGDRTTSGGVVELDGHRHVRVHGLLVALDGDAVRCTACGQVGRVVCVGPRPGVKVMGRILALSDDECRCGCFPPPRLLASQDFHSHVARESPPHSAPTRNRERDEAHSSSDSGHGSMPRLSDAVAGKPVKASRAIRLVDSTTGEVLAKQRCLFTLGGRAGEAISDSRGIVVVRTSDAASVDLHVVFVAPNGALVPTEAC